jgi:hypothetical protein
MTRWILDQPGKLELGQVDRVVVRMVEGAVSVVGSDGRPTLELSELVGEPLRVRQEGGALTIDYERPVGSGLLAWLTTRGKRKAVLSLAVPRDCRVELRGVSASLMVGGLRAPVVAKTVSGEITLAGLGGAAEAETVSGAVQASGVTGDLSAATVSGDLTVRLPEASDLEVKLQSTSGQVASAFDQLEHDRTPGRQAARGRIGSGTGRLRATSTSGHVALLRRASEASL